MTHTASQMTVEIASDFTRSHRIAVTSIEQAGRVVREYIETHDCGGREWAGGALRIGTARIGKISYNGRAWHRDGTEMAPTPVRTVQFFTAKPQKSVPVSRPDRQLILTTQLWAAVRAAYPTAHGLTRVSAHQAVFVNAEQTECYGVSISRAEADALGYVGL